MATTTSRALVTFTRIGRTHSDEDDIFNPAHMSLWRILPDVLSTRTYAVGAVTYEFAADWRRLAHEKRRQARYSARQWLKLPERRREKVWTFAHQVRVPVECKITSSPKLQAGYRTQIDLLTLFLYEVFFVANLSAPAALSAEQVDIKSPFGNVQIELPGLFFEEAWITAIRNGWPELEYVHLPDVWEWYLRLGIDTEQVATSRIARAVFSILHAARMSAEEPGTVVWVAQCLESVLDIRQAARTATLARMKTLCGSPPDESLVKSEIERFSTARNKIAHGTAPILHPLASSSLDNAAEDYFWNWLQPTFFASGLVLAALQEYARRQWREAVWDDANVLVSSSTA